MAPVSLKQVVKRFGKTEVVHGIDLEIDHNEFVVLVGPSGCGKSTTLRMIAGLEEISDGEIFIGDRLVNKLPPRARNVSMVFQNYALYPHMTVRENLGFSLKIAKQKSAVVAERVDEAAGILGLSDLMDRTPTQLSGGQRQRVAMGRAIVRHPDVFLFDEPLSNLDAKLRVQMRTEIKRLHQKVSTTVVYVTHDQVEAMTLADRIVIMKDGYIEQVGTPLDVFESPVNTFVSGFIGSPPMNQLPGRVISRDGRPMAEVDGLEVPLPPGIADKTQQDSAVILGIRAEDLMPQGHELDMRGESLEFERTVSIAEPLGTETLLFIDIAGQEVLSKMFNPRPISGGETVRFSLNLDKIHLFDAETGRRIGD
jgi:multiple sugar transport system ATP-binding protein